MKFGLFGSAQAQRGGVDVDSAQGFRDFVDYNVEAEGLGFHSTFVVEHHFTGFAQVSASLNLLTWVAARTSTLRLGTAVAVLPWHNPVLLAEEAATIDLMSNGRLEFGVGKGYRHNETAQKPHPPIWMAAGNPDSIRRVAARGFGLMLDQFALPETIIERFNLFKAEVEQRGRTFDPMTVAVARAFYVAKDAADKASAVERRLAATRRMTSLAQSPAGDNKSSMVSFADTREASEQSALFGTPDEIAGKLESLRRAGVAYVLLNGPGSRDQLRRFARDVMPAFADPAKIRVAG